MTREEFYALMIEYRNAKDDIVASVRFLKVWRAYDDLRVKNHKLETCNNELLEALMKNKSEWEQVANEPKNLVAWQMARDSIDKWSAK